MKNLKTLSAALLLSASLSGFAQDSTPNRPDWMGTVNKQEWAKLVDLLQTEKWQEADKTVTTYLARLDADLYRQNDAEILRYMLITSVAGELANGVIDNAEALKKLKPLEGKTVITPTVTFKSKGILNVVMLADSGKAWMKDTTNTEADMMMLSELFEVALPDMLKDSDRFNNKKFRMKATVKSISADKLKNKYLTLNYTGTEIWDIPFGE